MLKVKGLDYSYDKEKVLHNAFFQAGCGEIISLIGPNGSGKSTLLRCISGLLKLKKPETVQLNGRGLHSYKKKELARQIAFLPQFQEKMPGVSVRQLVALGRTPYQRTGWVLSKNDRDAVDWALSYLHLSSFQNRFVDQLSGGERQRAWIAMALAQDTPIILLDEPVTYMDLKHQWEMLETIHQLKENFGKTLISVFHDINHAMEVSDQVCLMHEGRVHQMGGADQVVTEEALEQVYGIRVHVCRMKSCCRSVIVPEGRRRLKFQEDEAQVDLKMLI